MVCNGARNELPAVVADLDAKIIEEHGASLNEIFMAHAGGLLPESAAEGSVKS